MVKTLTKEEIEQLNPEDKIKYFFNLLSINPIAFAKYYLNNHFRIATPWFHLEIIKEAVGSDFFACASPRESAKSTIISLLMPLHAICFKRKRFVLITSNTYSKAANTLESIKNELRVNQLLKQDFRVEIKKDREGDTIFRHKDGYETRVLCKGAEQIGSVRGEKFGAYRPDMIIVDDLEDDELVKNPLRRRDLKDVYDEALIPAGEKGNVQVLVIGTILHDDSLMAKLVSPREYLEYNKLLYRALNKIDGEKISLWPEKWSIEWLENLQKIKPSVFAKEYQNDPSYGIFGVFKKENFRYWTIEDGKYILFDEEMKVKSKGELTDCRAAIACDLAWEEKRTSDYSVILPAFLTPTSDILVDSYICKKGMRPNEFEEIIFSMEQRYKAITGVNVMIGLEKAKLEKVMRWVLTQAMKRRNHYLSLKDLLWDTDKIQRIETRLESRYAMNTIYHKRGMSDLEDQLLRLRSAAHDDLCFVKGTKVATLYGDKNIEDIKAGDKVITPDGLRKVNKVFNNGEKRVIKKFGLTATPNHPVFDTVKGIDQLSNLCYLDNVSRLTKKELLVWKYKSLLHSMGSSTASWVGKENITLVNQQQIRDGKILKDFMWRCGSFITKKKYREVFVFIIKTVTLLTTTSLIWNVYHISNIGNLLKEIMLRTGKLLIKRALSPLYGINHKLVEIGINSMAYGAGLIGSINTSSVNFVERVLGLKTLNHLNFALINTAKITSYQSGIIQKKEVVSFAPKSSRSNTSTINAAPVLLPAELNTDIQNVFNISVEKAHLYYANNILVGNCDSLQGAVQLLENPRSATKVKVTGDDEFEWWRQQAINAHKPKQNTYVFGNKNKYWGIPCTLAYR